ncbi:PEPxxWA-CTERM sorting domain-containing protein [Sphingomonas panacisoli]|uniref:PEPxxWA-CTERM sorting domain-containing protein n=1 Tax=Sphingomonas panacisoli TaxID=1813879 RepID=UPI001F00957D|nr:PEPxxWA-CTERM sorting domain-containing protein [Sphingomonas panacisoli]
MRFTILAVAALAAGTFALPAQGQVLDNFNRANTAAGANGLGADWSMLKAGASISGNVATGGTQALYLYNGSGPYAANQAEFDFLTASSPTTGSYYDGALLNWDGTGGYFVKVQHSAGGGFNKYGIGYVSYNSGTGLFTYTNGVFADIGATLTSGHLSASVLNGVGTLTLTSGASSYTFNYTYGAGQTFIGTGIGLGIQDGARLDNFGSTAPVPEPATWGMLLVGFGAVGATLRRRRAVTRIAFA